MHQLVLQQKELRSMYVQQQIQRPYLKPERALTTLPTIAGNTSTAFPASLLSTSASLPNHLFSSPSSPLPRPKAPAVASTIAEMVIEREVSIEKIFIPCSRK